MHWADIKHTLAIDYCDWPSYYCSILHRVLVVNQDNFAIIQYNLCHTLLFKLLYVGQAAIAAR